MNEGKFVEGCVGGRLGRSGSGFVSELSCNVIGYRYRLIIIIIIWDID